MFCSGHGIYIASSVVRLAQEVEHHFISGCRRFDSCTISGETPLADEKKFSYL